MLEPEHGRGPWFDKHWTRLLRYAQGAGVARTTLPRPNDIRISLQICSNRHTSESSGFFGDLTQGSSTVLCQHAKRAACTLPYRRKEEQGKEEREAKEETKECDHERPTDCRFLEPVTMIAPDH